MERLLHYPDCCRGCRVLSMKAVRRIVESDLGLPKKQLDEAKDVVTALVDQIVFKKDEPAGEQQPAKTEAAAPKGKATKAGSSRKRPKPQQEDADDADEDDFDVLSRKQQAKKAGQPASKKRKTAAVGSDSDGAAAGSEDDFEQPAPKRGGSKKAAASGGSKYGPKVEKLRRMCRAAGITIGPSVYVKNKGEAALTKALQELLVKHSLTPNSDAAALARVKAKLELSRDMEGIDMSNIISGDGGRPARRAAARVDFK
eukprot:GHRQ01026593.1.p2 GENE.GHRQ01026593.1~~GHRQ01026593.1.p2  ORF type:complete len:257 (+),score=130.45 GHRQ01026593.1:219-989(+)